MTNLAPTIFESFNARTLNSSQVARTFIPPENFTELIRRSHTLVIGPRGSGKTTLLKMLEEPALEAWAHPDADSVRQRVAFTGIFVPYDVTWNRQLSSVTEARLSNEFREAVAVASFTTHVLRATVAAMQYRIHGPMPHAGVRHRRVELNRDAEANLVQTLASSWKLELRVPSLLGLKYALLQRQSHLGELATKIALGVLDGDLTSENNYLFLDFLQATSLAVELFDDNINEPEGKWALLFDELELAPTFITEQLVRSLRSSVPKLLFKLSLSPFSREVRFFEDAFSAMPAQDYSVINLAYARKEDGYSFCRALLDAILRERGLRPIEPDRLLGRSEFMTEREEYRAAGTAYHKGSRLHKKLVRLRDQDASFRAYLERRGLELDRLEELDPERRASEVRKVIPLVTVRLAFRRPDESGFRHRLGRTRGRRNPQLYSGATSLFAMAEGNPRWFIGLITRLLDKHDPGVGHIPRHIQNAEVTSTVFRFRALLRSIPAYREESGRMRGILVEVDRIGDYFYDHCVLFPFTANPALAFRVDRNAPPSLLEGLGRALNAGALVYIPDPEGLPVFSTLAGKTFRLSYLLASYYGLPLGLGATRNLRRILRWNSSGQLPLFVP